MEKYRIAIIEDSKDDSNLLRQYLKKYESEKGYIFEINVFNNALSFLADFKNDFDLIFMDIDLPDGNGMDVIHKIREKDKDVLVIFTTNMSQYALKGYEVKAFDFMVKPITYNTFFLKLASAIDCLSQKRGKYIWISNRDGKIRVHSSRIKYIEIIKHMLIFHTLDGDYQQSGTLLMIEGELEGEPFVLCNRCYLVNLKYVSSVRQYDVYLGDEKLQISRAKRKSFMTALNNYLARGD
ncbi:MAG TPA: LytTR family DNA-binding domain-containing protein [Clostridia bacterium]